MISSSEDEVEDCNRVVISSSEDKVEDSSRVEVVDVKTPGKFAKSKELKDILSKVNGVEYDLSDVTSSNPILYSNEITKDDEIWLIQAPKDVNLESLEGTNFKFRNSSRMTLKARKREKHFNVHVIQSKNEEINSSLPMEKTQSFHMTFCPIVGRIILQEDFQVDNKNESLNKTITYSSSYISDSNFNLTGSQTSDAESIAPSKKKKRQSIKRDTV